MSVTSSLRARIDPVPQTVALAVGDLAAIATFVVLGQLQHGWDPVADVNIFAETYGTFLAGWVLAALLGGLYTRDAISTRRRAVSWTLPAWVAAVLVAQALRSTSAIHGNADPVFALVAVAFGGLLLVSWRALAATIVGKRM